MRPFILIVIFLLYGLNVNLMTCTVYHIFKLDVKTVPLTNTVFASRLLCWYLVPCYVVR